MNFEREQAILLSTVDAFFGTSGGLLYEELIPISEEGVVKKAAKAIKRFFRPEEEKYVDVFKRLSELELVICGGAVNSVFTNATVNDLDFYMRNPSKKRECIEFLSSFFKDEIYESINAFTFKRHSTKSRKKWSVQLITKFHGDPHKVFQNFDFTITHGAYCFYNQHFVLGERFLQDLACKRLVYAGASRYPICAMYRIKKYLDRGYNVSGATIMHIALSIVQLNIRNYADLKEQLMGIDTVYLQGVLDKHNPENPVDYGEFIEDVFKAIDRRNGKTLAEMEEE